MAIESFNGKTTPKRFAQDVLWDAISYIENRDSGTFEGTCAYSGAKLTEAEKEKIQVQWDKIKVFIAKKFPGTPNPRQPEEQ